MAAPAAVAAPGQVVALEAGCVYGQVPGCRLVEAAPEVGAVALQVAVVSTLLKYGQLTKRRRLQATRTWPSIFV